jgi:hypothetical protein
MSRRLVAGLIALMAAWAIFGLAFGAPHLKTKSGAS